MFTAITHSQIYVLDQDEALDFYVGKLGLEVAADADLGFMRWLTVSIPHQPERQILLERPGPPRLSTETAQQVRDLLTKGAMGGHLIFSTDDCRKTYEALRGKGVEFTEEPTERPYASTADSGTLSATASASPSRRHELAPVPLGANAHDKQRPGGEGLRSVRSAPL